MEADTRLRAACARLARVTLVTGFVLSMASWIAVEQLNAYVLDHGCPGQVSIVIGRFGTEISSITLSRSLIQIGLILIILVVWFVVPDCVERLFAAHQRRQARALRDEIVIEPDPVKRDLLRSLFRLRFSEMDLADAAGD